MCILSRMSGRILLLSKNAMAVQIAGVLVKKTRKHLQSDNLGRGLQSPCPLIDDRGSPLNSGGLAPKYVSSLIVL